MEVGRDARPLLFDKLVGLGEVPLHALHDVCDADCGTARDSSMTVYECAAILILDGICNKREGKGHCEPLVGKDKNKKIAIGLFFLLSKITQYIVVNILSSTVILTYIFNGRLHL